MNISLAVALTKRSYTHSNVNIFLKVAFNESVN